MAMLAQTKPVTVAVESAGSACAPHAADPGAWAGYFEEVYRDAAGDMSRIRWADGRPNPALLSWLTVEGPCLVRPGATAVVVGCGLGDDARELADRGYDVSAFDVSPTAVNWAKERHPEIADRFVQADLLALPPSMLRRADLVVEIYTVQSLHPALRERALQAVASLARPRGTILVLCRGRDESEPLGDEPPYPLSARELTDLMGAQGWRPTRTIDDFYDEQDPPKRRLRAAFRRA
jgi:SAM-dependent methyltransferase